MVSPVCSMVVFFWCVVVFADRQVSIFSKSLKDIPWSRGLFFIVSNVFFKTSPLLFLQHVCCFYTYCLYYTKRTTQQGAI